MGKVNNQNARSFDDYSKNDWVDFYKQGAYRGLKINKVARLLGKADSCVYDKSTHELTLTIVKVDKTKTIILKMDKLLRKNDRWTLSRLIHNIKMCFSNSDYTKKFNDRITKLAEATTKKTSNDFSLELNAFVDDQKIDNHDLTDIKTFFNQNLRIINESIGNQEIKDDLLKLSHKALEIADDAESRALAFQIQCTALALVPHPDVVWEALPPDVQKLIFSGVQNSAGINTDQPLNQLLVSKEVSKNVSEVKNIWINNNDICLKNLGCKTSEEAVQYIIDHKLTSANLSAFPDFDDADLEELSKNCPQLKKLSIQSKNFTGDKLAEALEKVPNLQSLDLTKCTQLTGDKLAEALGKLSNFKSLDLRRCTQLTGDKLAEALGKLSNLQSLDLSGCDQITGDKLTEALGKITNLQSLNLYGCEQITSDKLAEALSKLPNLQSLNLSWCEQITRDKLSEALEKVPNLKSLDLSWCNQITGDKLAEALSKLPNLQSLNLTWCYQITGDQLAEALEKVPNLKSLDLSWCYKITSDKLAEALEKVPNLQSLNLSGCDQITGDQIDELLRNRPGINLIR